jgi:hypothetical protein
MKLLPDSVTVPPAYAAADVAVDTVGLGLISNFICDGASTDCIGLLVMSFTEQFPKS